MKKRSYPLEEVYRLLEPGPVVMISTARKGRPNIMALSWQTMMEFTPPLVGFVLSDRNYTFDILRATKECVINIPTSKIAKEMIACGNTSGRKVDKFEKFGLTPLPASKVKAPMIGECYANLECKVYDSALVSKYNFFVVKVVKAWIDPKEKDPKTLHHRGKGIFTIDGKRIKTSSKMP